MVYDVTNQSSFDDINKFWINEVESYAEKNVEKLLIGNKTDQLEQKVISPEQGKQYADQFNMDFFECSARTADQVSNAFLALARKLMAKRDLQGKTPNNKPGIMPSPTTYQKDNKKLGQTNQSQKGAGCC